MIQCQLQPAVNNFLDLNHGAAGTQLGLSGLAQRNNSRPARLRHSGRLQIAGRNCSHTVVLNPQRSPRLPIQARRAAGAGPALRRSVCRRRRNARAAAQRTRVSRKDHPGHGADYNLTVHRRGKLVLAFHQPRVVSRRLQIDCQMPPS